MAPRHLDQRAKLITLARATQANPGQPGGVASAWARMPDLPNFGTTGGPVLREVQRFDAATVQALRERGHTVNETVVTSGLQTLQRAPGAWPGGADPRRGGVVAGD